MTSADTPISCRCLILTRLCSVILLTNLVVGCGAKTSVTSAWHEPREARAHFQHLLVVGVGPNSRDRRSFEEAMVAAIAKESSGTGTRATASIQSGDPTQELSPDVIAATVKSTGADAVLITRLVSRKVALKKTPDRTGTKAEQVSLSDADSVADVFRQEYNDYEEPGELVAKSKAIVETSLYDVADRSRRVYSITTKTQFVEGRDDVIAEVAAAIARQLRRDDIIP